MLKLKTITTLAMALLASFFLLTEAQAGKKPKEPTAVLNGPWTAEPGELITFSGAGSSSRNGEIVQYCFNYGDGSPDFCTIVQNAYHAYDNPGSYTVILTVTDSASQQGSTADTATIDYAIPGTEPDLVVTYIEGASQGTTGNIVPVSVTITNNGSAIATGTAQLAIYLSEDSVITTSDYKRTIIQVTNLGVGQSVTYDTEILLSSTIPTGIYYYGAIADELNDIAESDETNNTLASTGTLTIEAGQAAPAAPENLTASQRQRGNKYFHDLDWDAVAGATSYNIWRAFNSGSPYLYLTNVSTNTYSYRLSTSYPQNYCYKVTAINGNGESDLSGWACADGTVGSSETYESRVSNYRQLYGKTQEWEDWMLANQGRYNTAFERSRDLPAILPIAVRYETTPIAYNPPWANEDEHMLALEALAEPAYPGYDFDFIFNGDIGSAYANAVLGIASNTSYASGNTVYLYYETIFNHEFGHVMGVHHHYTSTNTVGQGENFPPGESGCIMDRNSNQWCSACRTALGLPLDVDNGAEITDAAHDIIIRYPY